MSYYNQFSDDGDSAAPGHAAAGNGDNAEPGNATGAHAQPDGQEEEDGAEKEKDGDEEEDASPSVPSSPLSPQPEMVTGELGRMCAIM